MKLAFLAEYLKAAEIVLAEGHFNSALTLYHRALDSVVEVRLLQKGVIYKNHHEKFEAIRKHCPEIGSTVAKLYGLYRDSYETPVDQPTAEFFKKELYALLRQSNIPNLEDLLPRKSLFPGDQKNFEIKI